MSGRALLAFAQKRNCGDKDDDEHGIYKYLKDAGFDASEVKDWGKIGSLMEVLKEDDNEPCSGCTLDESFIEFVKALPPGNTPRPIIRHQIQRTPV